MLEKILDNEKAESPDNYWGFRKEQVLLQRAGLKFRYFFRLIDLAAAVMMVYLGIVVITISEEPFPFIQGYGDSWLSLLGWVIAACGVGLYIWIRRLPPPIVELGNAEQMESPAAPDTDVDPGTTPESRQAQNSTEGQS